MTTSPLLPLNAKILSCKLFPLPPPPGEDVVFIPNGVTEHAKVPPPIPFVPPF